MFTNDGPALNDLPMQTFDEIKYQQPLLGAGNGAQGINGFLANYNFGGGPSDIPGEMTKAFPIAGASNIYEAVADMKLGKASIRNPSYVPVGLHNAVYSEIYEGAL